MVHPFSRTLALLFLAGSYPMVACSREKPAAWPARNYSGTYLARAETVSNDCDLPGFAATDTLFVTVDQSPDNETRVDVSPVVSVTGMFRGDRLEAYAAVPTSVLPERASPEAQAGAIDAGLPAGTDSVRYRLELAFEGESFRGEYRVEQPALGEGLKACHQTFRLEGVQMQARPAG